MICVLCKERMKAKCSTGNCHHEQKHPRWKYFTEDKSAHVLKQLKSNLLRQRATMRHTVEPNQLVKLAPYNLASIINKHKMF